jgi:hypothetical protein
LHLFGAEGESLRSVQAFGSLLQPPHARGKLPKDGPPRFDASAVDSVFAGWGADEFVPSARHADVGRASNAAVEIGAAGSPAWAWIGLMALLQREQVPEQRRGKQPLIPKNRK